VGIENIMSAKTNHLRPDTFISVVVATFNRASFLDSCLEKLLSNTYNNFEIIVVGQGTDDSTKRLISTKYANQAKLRYIHTDTVGLSHARNTGWKNARGDIIAFVDDDALVTPGWLEAYARVFSDIEPPPGMVGGRTVPSWEIECPHWFPKECEFLLGTYDIGNQIREFPDTDLPVGANFAMLRSVIKEVGEFNERVGFSLGREHSMIAGEDSLIALRVKEAGYKIYYQPDAKVFHYISAKKLTKRYFLRRHFWEGITTLVIQYILGIADLNSLPSIIRWHIRAIFGRIWLFFFPRDKSGINLSQAKAWMRLAAECSYSLGVIYCGLKLLWTQRLP
jgi:glycosyltransferase involved in cell wall biosynthesis